MASTSNSGELDIVPNVDDINNLEEVYYEENGINYANPPDNKDMNDDSVTAPQILLVSLLMTDVDRSIYDVLIGELLILDMRHHQLLN